MRIVLLVLLIGLLGNNIIAQNTLKEDFVKPMKLKPVVSGSFGELRSNHFHSGIDLTTNRKTGYRIYASDEGYVSRIKVSPSGYGKAIYIDHPGGYTTVYGHLNRYSDRIDSVVMAKQYEQNSFAVELFFKAGEMPVKRGEVIAYSGNSGSSGGPHLHYEVREKASQKPMNPMMFRNDVEDDVRPQIQGLKLYLLSDDAIIQGVRKEKYSPAVFYNKAFHPKGSTVFIAYGKIGVGVQVLDYLSDSWRKCGVSSIKLYSNDTLVYSSRIDKFSFAETRYLNSHIDYAEKRRSGKVIQKSFVEPNNRLSIYGVKNPYTVDIRQGQTKIMKYVIKDFSGNTSVLAFTLKGGKPLAAVNSTYTPGMYVRYDEKVELDTFGIKLKIPAKTFYTDIDLLIHKEMSSDKYLSAVYTVGDPYIPVHRSMTVSIKVPDSLVQFKDKLVMAGVTSTGKTYSLGGSYNDGYITTSTRSFGRFTMAVDTIAPTIKLKGQPVNNDYSKHQSINIIISDNYSGIARYECLIDGEWALFEYDAKRKLLVGSFKNISFLKSGVHQLRVKVKDNRNNETIKTFKFKV